MKSKTLLTILLCICTSIAFSQIKALKNQINSAKAESEEKAANSDRGKYFEGRPDSPGPDVESFKENIPAKKESFTDKISRYKEQGFKIAVVLYSGSIKTKPVPTSTTTTITTQRSLDGSLPSMRDDFTGIAQDFTDKLNNEFNTDVFELVDMKKIPYREARFGKVDDWEVTKYRLVMTYTIQPEYDYNYSMERYNGDFVVNMNVVGTEYENTKKGVKMRYPIRLANMGYFKKEYASEEELSISTVDELNALVNPPSGSEIAMQLQKSMEENMPKFIEKLKK